jgi:hypothetical protein
MVGAVPDEARYRGVPVFAAREVLERKYWNVSTGRQPRLHDAVR